MAEHLKRYVATFNLNIITSVDVQSTVYDQVGKQWLVRFRTSNGDVKAICKQVSFEAPLSHFEPFLESFVSPVTHFSFRQDPSDDIVGRLDKNSVY